jgi:glycerophosphoryl diester phosphodiesterase
MGDVRTPGERAFIASHRGGGATAPENTLPAIQAALTGGFDYVEVDVALTVDRQAVLMHDSTVDRTTDGHGRVGDLTFDAVRALDAGAWFDPQFTGTPVPTFAEFLDVLSASTGRALIELKGEWDAESLAALVADVDARDLERRVVVSSFDARSLALARQASEVIPRLVILKSIPPDVVGAVEEIGARGVVVDRRAVLKHPEIVDDLHAAGLRVVVYTLNDDAQWDEVTALGVDGIVTDDPGTLSSWQQAVADGE